MLRTRRAARRLDFAIPAINIVFLLLLFFLVSGSQKNAAEFGLLPPLAETVAATRLPRPLLVVASNGALSLDGRPVADADLAGRLADLVGAGPEPARLNLLANRDMPARALLRLMDAIRAQPGIELKLVTIRPQESGAKAAP